jgi:hypothetical protein
MKPSWLYKLNSKEQPQKDMNFFMTEGNNIDSKMQQQHHEGFSPMRSKEIASLSSRPASVPALWEWSN